MTPQEFKIYAKKELTRTMESLVAMVEQVTPAPSKQKKSGKKDKIQKAKARVYAKL